VAERRSVAADVVGSKPTSRPKLLSFCSVPAAQTLPRIAKASSAPVTKAAPAASVPVFAGTSGWAYPTWKPGFYSPGTPAKAFLESYASRLNSVEVNYTFRTLPTAKMLEGWLAATPDNFRFSFKAPQRITHFRRLKDCIDDVEQLIAALEPLREAKKMGLVLFQLPPNFKADAERLNSFLFVPAFRGADAPKIAFEFRHESWFNEEIYTVLRQHNVALCIAEGDDLLTPEVQTATAHTCFRLRRSGGYSALELDAFAKRLLSVAGQRDTYVYFRHEDEPTGALNATAFLARIAAAEDDR
jgi:uncharacterized protein YecE (DUF72 family)